jgi:hypothetical protein
MIERTMTRSTLSREQLSKIEQLGKNVGLEREEIIAAIDNPIPNSGIPGHPKSLLIVTFVAIAVIVVGLVLMVWTVVDPETSPIHTYVPGSLYGTIRPQDFAAA